MSSERRSRIDALLRAAARLSDRSDPCGAAARSRLRGVVGLSPENIALCLEHHLETEASPLLFGALSGEHEAPRVHVVLSANVFVAPLRALVLAALCADQIVVVPSRREPHFVRLLLSALQGTPFVKVVDELAPAPGDHLHVYGRDETIAAVERDWPESTVWGHGSGVGIVVQRDGENLDPEAVADDVVPFDQRGCLSPRVVVVRRGGRRFADALARVLGARANKVPLGEFDLNERERAGCYGATMQSVGELFGSPGALVGFDPDGGPLHVPSPPRTVHVIESGDPWMLLERHAPMFTCVSGDDDEIAQRLPLARRAPVGRMQRPPLDGPVDPKHLERFRLKTRAF